MSHLERSLTSVVLITRSELCLLGIEYSNTHLLRLERAGLFPKRIYLSPHKICWKQTEIGAWIHERASHRNDVRRDSHD